MEDTPLSSELCINFSPGKQGKICMLCLQVQAKQPVHEKFWIEPSNQAHGHDVMEFEYGSADGRALAGSTENASKQTIAFRDFTSIITRLTFLNLRLV